jgi:hypothetical protein
MSRKTMIVAMCIITALNIVLTIVNFSTQSRASVAGMDARDLRTDRDFRHAVEYIVESCTVNESSISC